MVLDGMSRGAKEPRGVSTYSLPYSSLFGREASSKSPFRAKIVEKGELCSKKRGFSGVSVYHYVNRSFFGNCGKPFICSVLSIAVSLRTACPKRVIGGRGWVAVRGADRKL